MEYTIYIAFLILTCLLAGLFAVLHLIAAVSQLRKETHPSHILMLASSLVVLSAVTGCLLGSGFDWLLLLVGGGMVCAAAIWNGRRSGTLHLSHHITRAAVVLILVLNFIRI